MRSGFIVMSRSNNQSRRPGGSCQGFTLIEILLAIFVFAVVVAIIQSTYTGTFRLVRKTESQIALYRKARIAMERIGEDLQSAYAVPLAGDVEDETAVPGRFTGSSQNLNGEEADSMSFTSRAHLVFSEQESEAGKTTISYSVLESDDEEGLLLLRADQPDLVVGGGAEDGQLLCDRLKSVRFTYFDIDGDEHEAWDSTAEEYGRTTPALVRIRLVFIDEANPEAGLPFQTSVALPVIGQAGESRQQ